MSPKTIYFIRNSGSKPVYQRGGDDHYTQAKCNSNAGYGNNQSRKRPFFIMNYLFGDKKFEPHP